MKFTKYEDKYDYRREGIPYNLKRKIVKCGGFSLVEIEIFDGKKVEWFITEEAESLGNFTFTSTTPIFDNLRFANGQDKARIIFKDDMMGRLVVRGKLNKKEVLCEVNSSGGILNPDYFSIYPINGNNVEMFYENKKQGILRIDYNRDGLERSIYFDCKRFEPCCSEIDILYANNCFIKTYVVNDRIRVIIGELDLSSKTIKSMAYDPIKEEFFELPFVSKPFHYDMIDDTLMMQMLGEDKDLGLNKNYYKGINKSNLSNITMGFGYDFDKANEAIFERLKEYNQGKVYKK